MILTTSERYAVLSGAQHPSKQPLRARLMSAIYPELRSSLPGRITDDHCRDLAYDAACSACDELGRLLA